MAVSKVEEPPFLFTPSLFRCAYYVSRDTLGQAMIRSFRCRRTEALFNDVSVPRFRAFERVARRKLLYLHRARSLRDLRAPPGNRLEALRGDRKGQHSIRVNDRWRVCFEWNNGDAHDVEIVDYH